MAISLWTISIMVAPAIGPTVGGLLTNSFGWKTLFFSCVPIGIIATLCAILFIPSSTKKNSVSLDLVGLITVIIGNVSILMYFTKGPELGWLSIPALALFILGLVSIILFVWRELTANEPLLDLSVLKYPKFAIGTILNCLISIGLYSSVYLLPLFMEEAQGATSFMSGFVMFPGAIIMIVVTMLTGKLNDKLNPSWFVLGGSILLCVATWAFSQLKMDSSIAYIIGIMIVRYMGVGLATSPLTNISMSDIPTDKIGHATSISNWLRQAVAALSIAIFSSILAVRTQIHLADLNGIWN